MMMMMIWICASLVYSLRFPIRV